MEHARFPLINNPVKDMTPAASTQHSRTAAHAFRIKASGGKKLWENGLWRTHTRRQDFILT